ncbi:MAG TPA: succinylglutamate desuccinylase/aspartoacylase family protein, partial [Balneolaceae bacterium]|nr:succinylglutamate desuccinylase/aspartoacylase family protein [Balneolaceae bacterium]
MPEIIEINNHKIGRGEQQVVMLKLARLPSFETIELEVHLFRAEKEGPVLLLTGGMHGDEINGVEILRRLIADKKLVPETGTVIVVPLINVFGFIQKERDMPDGKDINRSFPGSKSGSLARLVASTLMKKVLPYADFGVDFHTGGQSRKNYPHIRCMLDVEQNKELAKAFAPPMIVNSFLIDHSFRKSARNNGKQILVYESGEANRFYEAGIQTGINGVLRLMKYLGMRTKAPASQATAIFGNSTWIRAT